MGVFVELSEKEGTFVGTVAKRRKFDYNKKKETAFEAKRQMLRQGEGLSDMFSFSYSRYRSYWDWKSP